MDKAAHTDSAQLMQAEQQLAQAHVDLDLDTIAALLHRDYVIVQQDSRVETREMILASYRSGDRFWESASVDQLDVRLYGTAALVIGRWQAKGTNAGTQFDYAARFLSMWIKEDGRWQNVSNQSAEIPSRTA